MATLGPRVDPFPSSSFISNKSQHHKFLQKLIPQVMLGRLAMGEGQEQAVPSPLYSHI